jgi:hypothetical protein
MDEGVRLMTREEQPAKKKRGTSSDLDDMEEYPAQRAVPRSVLEMPSLTGPGALASYHQSAGILMPTKQNMSGRKMMFEAMEHSLKKPGPSPSAQALPLGNDPISINKDINAQYFKVSNPNEI